MKEWWERWGTMVGIAVVVGGGSWAIRSSIADVREDLTAEISDVREDLTAEISDVREDLTAEISGVREEVHRIEVRMASVESKLDLLIEGLDIEVGPKVASSGGNE
ncbi:MAG: hypothetical protein OXI76_09460 [Gemmatimonadota bacterium]|nr:hypothetical protein [Gemmatimonadota bacterium]